MCISAGDYEASATAVEKMASAGLQPEPEQEKRMLQECVDPLWVSKRGRARATEAEAGAGEGEVGEERGIDGADFWREKDGADQQAEGGETAEWRE